MAARSASTRECWNSQRTKAGKSGRRDHSAPYVATQSRAVSGSPRLLPRQIASGIGSGVPHSASAM